MFIKGVNVTYKMFQQKNDQNKMMLKQNPNMARNGILHIDSIKSSGVTPFEDKACLNGKMCTVQQLIHDICWGGHAVSNPSALEDWCGWTYLPTPTISIMKQAGKKKDAFRLTGSKKGADIPPFLQQAVELKGVENSKFYFILHALEGDEVITINDADSIVVAYEIVDSAKVENAYKLKKASDGNIYNVWWKKNAATTLVEKDGVFYEKPKPVEAQLATEKFPSFLGTPSALQNRLKQIQGGWAFKVSWSPEPLKATNYKGFWVKYGDADFNFLEMGTDSANGYFLADKEGKSLKMPLAEYYQKLIAGYDITKI